MAATNAIARLASALNRVLISVPSRNMLMYRMGVKLLMAQVPVNAPSDHDRAMGWLTASNPWNTARAGRQAGPKRA